MKCYTNKRKGLYSMKRLTEEIQNQFTEVINPKTIINNKSLTNYSNYIKELEEKSPNKSDQNPDFCF